MRATAGLYSGMPTGDKYMGWWGNMGGPKQKGITQYALSPMQQNPMKGAFRHWITNGTRRLAQQSLYFAVPFAAAYGIIQWATHENHIRNSKEGVLLGRLP